MLRFLGAAIAAALLSFVLSAAPSALAQTTNAPPACYPLGIKGDPAKTKFELDWVRRTDAGWYVFWFCQDEFQRWNGWSLFCSHGRCDQSLWLAVEVEILRELQPGRAASADGSWQANVKPIRCRDQVRDNGPDAAVCAHLLAHVDPIAIALNPVPPVPPPEIWRVRPSGTSTSRVVYLTVTVAGQLRRGSLTSPLITVDVGTVCDPAIRVDDPITGLIYMGVPGGIAVCAKQP